MVQKRRKRTKNTTLSRAVSKSWVKDPATRRENHAPISGLALASASARSDSLAADLARERAPRLAERYFPCVQPLTSYVAEVNTSLPPGTPRIVLSRPEDVSFPAYHRLVSQVLIAWPGGASSTRVPQGIGEGLTTLPGAVSHDELIARVISSVLKRYPDGYTAQSKNVLCNGFSLGRPGGKGSMFRNLDVRAPSSAVNALRSPAWKRLFARLGHVAARHLLDHAVLLVPIASTRRDMASTESSQDSLNKQEATTVTLVQLCGPLPQRPLSEWSRPRQDSVIGMKQDVLYHGPIRRGNVSIEHERGTDGCAKKNSSGCVLELLNRGLPFSHPLQPLRAAGDGDALTLFGMMFPIFLKRKRSSDSKASGEPADQPSQKRHCGERTSEHSSGMADGEGDSYSHDCIVKVPPRMQTILPHLKAFLRRASKRSFRAVLGIACPISADDNPCRTKRSQTNSELASLSTPSCDVARFLIHCFRQMLPPHILGSIHNRTLFEQALTTLVRRRTQNEELHIPALFAERGLRVTEISWLGSSKNTNSQRVCNPTDLKFRHQRLDELLKFLVQDVCLPLLHQNFYVSERENTRHRVVFFRREVWSALTDATMRDMLKSNRRQYTMLSRSALANVMRQRKATITGLGTWFCPFPVLTLSRIRFLPKSSGARGIQRPHFKLLRGFARDRPQGCALSRLPVAGKLPAAVIQEKAKSAMKAFHLNALEILTAECRSRPEVLGASVFSNDEIYSKYCKLVLSWKRHSCPAMYVMCTDITRSFDTVPLGPLVSQVLPQVLQRERYVVLRYVVVRRDVATGTLMYRFCNYVCQEPGEETHFPRLVREKLGFLHLGALVVDLVSVTTIERNDLMDALNEVITNNVISVPRRMRPRSKTAYAIQCKGLAQGSQLSPLLTTLFYGYVERTDLSAFLSAPDNLVPDGKSQEIPRPLLFMRLVDDSLFASYDETVAKQLAVRMSQGWDSTHGFSINPRKTRANFDGGVGGATSLQELPWCGFFIDTKSLEVRSDYERYGNAGSRVRDTLTIFHGPNAIKAFVRRARVCFRPKLHAILLDSQINSQTRIALNIYQAALLSALKFCSYAKELFSRRPADPNTPQFLGNLACSMVSRFCDLVHFSVTNSVALRNGCVFPLQRDDVAFLVSFGFNEIIERRGNEFWSKLAIRTLSGRVAALQFHEKRGVICDRRKVFRSVILPSASQSLWSLRL